MELEQLITKDGRWNGETHDYAFKLSDLDAKTGTFKGIASKTGIEDSYGDTIHEGAFKRTIQSWQKSGNMVPVLWQHMFYEVIGGMDPHLMTETKRGLEVEGKLILSIQRAEEAHILLMEKILKGMSIGFTIPKGKSKWSDDFLKRDIYEVRLWENSIVTFPANPGAKVTQVRATDEEIRQEAEDSRKHSEALLNLRRSAERIESDAFVSSMLSTLNKLEEMEKC